MENNSTHTVGHCQVCGIISIDVWTFESIDGTETPLCFTCTDAVESGEHTL